ncbi:MAG: hypothetical protein HYU53_12250 [Acidobacteria bacterium]|nr:hypothetical protein [Acidobacteriota bacterium]
MFMAWFFWLFVLCGGAYMGGAALTMALTGAPSVVNLLNAVVYLGCAVAAVPRIRRLWRRRAAGGGHRR